MSADKAVQCYRDLCNLVAPRLQREDAPTSIVAGLLLAGAAIEHARQCGVSDESIAHVLKGSGHEVAELFDGAMP